MLAGETFGNGTLGFVVCVHSGKGIVDLSHMAIDVVIRGVKFSDIVTRFLMFTMSNKPVWGPFDISKDTGDLVHRNEVLTQGTKAISPDQAPHNPTV